MPPSSADRSLAPEQAVADASQPLLLRLNPASPTPSYASNSNLSSLSNPNIASQATSISNSNSVSEWDEPYAKASKYLLDFRHWESSHHVTVSLEDYSQPFRCNLSRPDWLRLCNEFTVHDPEDGFPRFSNDASTSIATIQCISSPIDELVTSFIGSHLADLLGAMNEGTRSRRRRQSRV
ncbi:uncharacterized protein Z519_12142 [Cladophialophora bantiana CBS 173.52]|uniref:Uncharacterized protein n=1 Tax=Cladophialophora bantiana (strain ATCC 10958 / CBS 173.52 / CDC B-1940 / NIH 8579) TaxID=1442370 RepID=A0A0D2HS81_CLAB1|nr:uncharacterized protein Z519_12142 [Cladophialophora bantiana CBS 173.52]KIW87239.1 hypothetical protein Z519_12142 [Cladophialophora bantiana CBS 173.52]